MLDILEALKEKLGIRSKHKWGYQIELVNEDEYCGKLLVLENMEWGSYHFHHKKKETFVVLFGAALIMKEGNDPWCCKVGDKVTILPNEAHKVRLSDCIQGVKICVLLEISTRDKDSDTYRINDNQTSS